MQSQLQTWLLGKMGCQIFNVSDVINDVTAWRKSQPSIYICKQIWHTFHDNFKTIYDIITKINV